MGGGRWSTQSYTDRTASKIASGTTFGYDTYARRTGVAKAHEDLDPKKRNADNVLIREARDSDEHPDSLPIVVGFDATGSMGAIPREAQKNLTSLFGLLLKKGYVDDPQIAVTAYGDAYVDYVPLQISQFESDNRIDDNLDNLFLEGGGGGNGGETQTLLWYFLANHTAIDSYEKRGKKGYLFIVADEVALDLNQSQIREYIAPDEVATHDLTVEGVVNHLNEQWDTYILLVDNFQAKAQQSEEFYTRLFGRDHVLVLEDTSNIAEVIGSAIGVLEGRVGNSDLENDLVDVGASKDVARRTSKTVAHLTPGDATLATVEGVEGSGRSAGLL